MMRSLLRKAFYAAMPGPLVRVYLERRLLRRALELRSRAAELQDPGELVDAIASYHEFRPIQIRSEIVALLRRVAALQPRTILEIGAASGGTTFLFSRAAGPGAVVVSIDLSFDDARIAAAGSLAAGGVSLRCLDSDSHDPRTVEAVRELFDHRPVDFLFIDGDHSYEGVKSDFEMYGPLVRRGGLIAFHDIVPDSRMRFGRQTVVDVGGVPLFWEELRKRTDLRTEEMIEHPDQDGYGIGLVRVE